MASLAELIRAVTQQAPAMVEAQLREISSRRRQVDKIYNDVDLSFAIIIQAIEEQLNDLDAQALQLEEIPSDTQALASMAAESSLAEVPLTPEQAAAVLAEAFNQLYGQALFGLLDTDHLRTQTPIIEEPPTKKETETDPSLSNLKISVITPPTDGWMRLWPGRNPAPRNAQVAYQRCAPQITDQILRRGKPVTTPTSNLGRGKDNLLGLAANLANVVQLRDLVNGISPRSHVQRHVLAAVLTNVAARCSTDSKTKCLRFDNNSTAVKIVVEMANKGENLDFNLAAAVIQTHLDTITQSS